MVLSYIGCTPDSQNKNECSLDLSANEMLFFIAEFGRAAKIRKVAVYRFLTSLLFPEL